MSTNSSSLNKIAVDTNAEDYWTEYFKDTGYGKLWVRKIPKRVKAELLKSLSLRERTASSEAQTRFVPLASIISQYGVIVEGIASFGEGPSRKVKAFVAEFDHNGSIEAFDFINVK